MKLQLSGIPEVVTLIFRLNNSLSIIYSLLFRINKSPEQILFFSKLAFSFLTGKAGSPKLSNLNNVYFLI
jgi:hypothetical protein